MSPFWSHLTLYTAVISGGLGALLPGSYLPQSYTDDLPSVQLLKMLRDARTRMISEVSSAAAHFTLGKI